MRLDKLLDEFERLNMAADAVVGLLRRDCPGEAASLDRIVKRCKAIIDSEKKDLKHHGRETPTTRA